MKFFLATVLTLTSMSSFALTSKLAMGPSHPIYIEDDERQPCGRHGSINKRIEDCSLQEQASNGSFVLVTRKKFKVVQKDTKSGLLWGDTLSKYLSYDEALKACKNGLPEVGGIRRDWRLPTIEEFKEANYNGMRTALPNSEHVFWSSTADEKNLNIAWIFDTEEDSVPGNNDDAYYDVRWSPYAVRCVARSEK